MEIKSAATKEDFINCWRVVQGWQPQLGQEAFLHAILHMLDEGYLMMFVEADGRVVSVCGYHFLTHFYEGKTLLLDVLCTAPEAQRNGYATALLHHIIQEAQSAGAKTVQISSGHAQYHLHRLLMKEGFRNTAHHFVLGL